MYQNRTAQRVGLGLCLLLVAVSVLDLVLDWLKGKPDFLLILVALFFAVGAYACWRRLRQA